MRIFKKKAFSFIELSMVILVIGLLLATTFYANSILDKARIATAKNLTTNSIVHSIDDLQLWLETSIDENITSTESGDSISISEWRDVNIRGMRIKASQDTQNNKPDYSGKINKIPSITFSGDTYLEFDGSFLNNSDYTIMVVEKRLSDKSDNYFMGDSAITDENGNILLGYASDQSLSHSQGGDNHYASTIQSYADYSYQRIITFVQKSSSGKKFYINGYLTGESNNTDLVTDLSTIPIGKGYIGEIGEIIIFGNSLKNSERILVEEYLGDKWSIVTDSNNSSCVNGIVSNDGCEIPSCSENVTGIDTPIIADSGDSGTATCNASHYEGSVDYTCNGSTLEITGSCSCATGYIGVGCSSCDEDAGYSMQGGSCSLTSCDISGIAGITDTTVSGSSSLTCDVVGYSGSIDYACTTGPNADITGSCGCDTAGGYQEISGSCVSVCTGGTIDTTSVPNRVVHKFTSSGTFTCSEEKYANILVVAGGGGGGGYQWGQPGGGGGAGGLKYQSSYYVPTGSATVTVGNGGPVDTMGENSYFTTSSSTISTTGGGRGGKGGNGGSGGSGGGGSGNNPTRTGGSGTSGQGQSGGNGNSCGASGGGGGANAAGTVPSSTVAPDGGDGKTYDITGVNVTYAGGGGGGGDCAPAVGQGGAGGGGTASNGVANTGGGGGFNNAGGSGIVIISYPF